MSPWRWLTDSLRGAKAYLASVFLAVLVAPILPDVAVDAFGDTVPAWLLRPLTVVALFGSCAITYAWMRGLKRRRARVHLIPDMHHVKPCDILIAAISTQSEFRPSSARGSDTSVLEYLMDHASPELLLLIVPASAENFDQTHHNLAAENIDLHIASISNSFDPEIVFREINTRVMQILSGQKLATKKITIDLTAGTKPISLAMYYLAQKLTANVAYVWRHGGRNGPSKGRTFDPQPYYEL